MYLLKTDDLHDTKTIIMGKKFPSWLVLFYWQSLVQSSTSKHLNNWLQPKPNSLAEGNVLQVKF